MLTVPSFMWYKNSIPQVLVFVLFVCSGSMMGQLNGTKSIPGNYTTIAAAITALNTSGVSGPVVFNVAAGHTESFSSPTAGTITATGTAVNTITFQKSGTGANPLITAGTGTGATDGIIKISGGDYITFDGIDLQEKSANSGSTALMEWGYAILKKNSTAPFDGSQNVTIKNCSVTLNKTNVFSVGVFSGNHTATSTTLLTITAASDAVNYLTINNVNIRNVNTGISVIGYVAPSPYTLYNQNIEVKNCNIQNLTTNLASYGINVRYFNNLVVYNNTIINAGDGGSNSTTSVYGIYASPATSTGVNIRSNTVELGCTVGVLAPIYNLASGNIVINSNIIQNFSHTSANSYYGMISQLTAGLAVTVDSNIIRNSGTLSFTSGGGLQCLNVNNSSNSTSVSNNTIANINCSSTVGVLQGIYLTGSKGAVVSNNSIYGFNSTSSSSSMTAIFITSSGDYQLTVSNNSVKKASTGYGSLTGITVSGGSTASECTDNTVDSLTGYSNVYGIYEANTSRSWLVSRNSISGLVSNGVLTRTVIGIYIGAGSDSTYSTISRNSISNLTNMSSTGYVYGIDYYTGTNPHYIYNNMISGLRAPYSSTGIAGIILEGGRTSSAHGVYYNTVFLNASCTSSTFTSAAMYIKKGFPVISRNNIFVNMSAAGNGHFLSKTIALKRDTTDISEYSPSSDYNLYYVNPAAASKAIYLDGTNYDSTLASFKARMATRDQNSVMDFPPFLDTTTMPYNLHLSTTIATWANNKGISITAPLAITSDYDGNTRNVETPDIGADEFDGITPSLASLLRLRALVEGLYNSGTNTMVADTMKVFVRRSFAPFSVVDSASVLLSTTGEGVYSFGQAIRDSVYFLQLYNKRAIQTWSKTAVPFNADTVTYDFTTAANKAYGDNQVLKGAKYCLYSGDVNGDGVIDLGDVIQIDNDNANFVTGDVASDLNGDGVVDLTDLLMADNNSANFISVLTPLNSKRPVIGTVQR